MAQWMRTAWVLCVLGVAGLALADPPAGCFSDELGGARYDCTLTVTPPAAPAEHSGVTFTLEAGAGNDALRLSVRGQELQVESVVAGKTSRIDPAPVQVSPGIPFHLTVLRRDGWLGLEHDHTFLFRGAVPRPTGNHGGFVADTGWTVEEPVVQPLEPVAFSDNFMRTADEPGNWLLCSGKWALQSAWDREPKGNANRFINTSFAQNPFAWTGANPNGNAYCTTGKPYWEDYTFTTAVQPGAGGAVGMLVNMADASNGYLVRWSPAYDRGPQGNRLTLARWTRGKTEVVAESPGGYFPGQWYKLAVISTLDGLQVLVDDQPRLSEKITWPWRGGVGLYTEGKNGAVFDDVTAYGNTINKDIIAENQQARINERFQHDRNGMEAWATRTEWTMFPNTPNRLLYDSDCYGSQWMALNVRPLASKAGELQLVLNSNGKSPTSGYRAVVKLADGKLSYTLFRDTASLGTLTAKPLSTATNYSFRFWHEGNKLRLEQDSELVLEAQNVAPLSSQRPSYSAGGCFALARDVVLMGRNRLDYGFTEAPVDWIEQGTWMQTSRWACSPQWSFLGGWSRGDAVLWHKKRFIGDQSFDAFVGVKIEYPHERATYDKRYRDFAIAICSDGHDPRSGYAGVFGAADADGRPDQRTVLLRHGMVVASVRLTPPGDNQAHQQWFELELRKRGATVELWVRGKKVLSYTDPKPLNEGIPAIWTMDNGILVARAQLHFANPPQPRSESQVMLDNLPYPEWANLNRPLTLDFAGACSTSGHPVTLKVATRQTPKGDEGAIAVQDTCATLTPQKLGDHWYQINALDGAIKSPPFYLSLLAFNPALKRNDAHAIVLYRFDEGDGNLVHDYSKIGTPANLLIPPDADVAWLPAQGLRLRRDAMVKSKDVVTKLMRLAKSQECTLEFWVSADTIVQSADVHGGSLLSWQKKPESQNLGVWHYGGALYFAADGHGFDEDDSSGFGLGNFHTSLHHYVLTVREHTACWYMDGKQVNKQGGTFGSDKWAENAYLVLGKQFHEQGSFLGTYYLLAIHDRSLTADEVMRHYQAGPTAR